MCSSWCKTITLASNIPDFSPIEHVWNMMNRKLTISPEPATTIAELRQRVQDALDNQSQDDIRHLKTTAESSDTPPKHCAHHVQQSFVMSIQLPAGLQCDRVQMAKLRQQVQDSWDNLSQDDIRHLYDSLHATVHSCVAARGGYNMYSCDCLSTHYCDICVSFGLSRPRCSSGYHTRLWIRGSQVRSRQGSMDFFRA